MARYSTIPDAARHFNVHPRTISNWLDSRYVTGYDDGSRQLRVDIDEIEAALPKNRKMRDGRKRHGNAHVVPMPVSAVGIDR